MHAKPETCALLFKALDNVMRELWPCMRPGILGWHGLVNVGPKDRYAATTLEKFRDAFVKHVRPVAPHLTAVVEMRLMHLHGRDLDRFKTHVGCRFMGLLLAFCEAAAAESDENAHVLAGYIVELVRMDGTLAAGVMTELVFGDRA